MKRNVFLILSALAVFASGAAEAQSGIPESIVSCYRKAGDDRHRINGCLLREFAALEAEHKDVTERVAVIAKAWDKPNRNRVRWEKSIRSNQAFKSYVQRECDFIENTTKGPRIAEKNAELSCRINLYRMRVDFLENRYLSAAKK